MANATHDFETIELDVDADAHIATITVNRPDKLNALNATVVDELKAAADHVREQDGVRVTVITGAGRAFVAGADIAAMQDMSEREAITFAERGHTTMDAIAQLPMPVVAAVNGFALGGGLELALACDLIYASEKAVFGLPEVGLGIIPGFGGTQRLGRAIGWHHARDLVFSGRHVRADEAKRIGLALDVFSAEDFLDTVYEACATIASRGPVAVRIAKRVMRAGSEEPLHEANLQERNAFGELFGTADRKEGMTAFLNKREPNFVGE